MKALIFIAVLLIAFGVQHGRCDEHSDSADKATTLSELSKMSGVTVAVDTVPKPGSSGLGIPGVLEPDFKHPYNVVKILFFPGATVFSPDFFKNFGETFSPPSRPLFPSDLKLFLVVRDADQTELARVPLEYTIVSNTDGPLHFWITFTIAPNAMKNSDLLIDEYPPSTHYVAARTKVSLRAWPDQK